MKTWKCGSYERLSKEDKKALKAKGIKRFEIDKINAYFEEKET